MPASTLSGLSRSAKKEYDKYGPSCAIRDVEIKYLSQYFAVLSGVWKRDEIFWFRGHADLQWALKPSALRYETKELRDAALKLISRFKRFAEMKIDRPPVRGDELRWVQLAQHYGLPTRLLDWTENAAIALYFACANPKTNGLVFILNPVDLNKRVNTSWSRIFDVNEDEDSDIISPYLKLGGGFDPHSGLKTIAIQPTWNSERIILQQGVFTLHGSKFFTLTGGPNGQVPSLSYLPILGKYKESLMKELIKWGVNEMSIFPEPEHVFSFLKKHANLPY